MARPNECAVRDGFAAGLSMAEIAGQIGVKVRHVEYLARKQGIYHRSTALTREERFFRFVHPEPNTGCFLWAGALNSNGRANFRDQGSTRLASHVAMELNGTSVPDGMFALHRCDNPACVNPDHIFFGRWLENVRDSRAKGRLAQIPPARKFRPVLDTHCVNGHLMAGDNLYVAPSGAKHCRQCRNEHARNFRRRRAQS